MYHIVSMQTLNMCTRRLLMVYTLRQLITEKSYLRILHQVIFMISFIEFFFHEKKKIINWYSFIYKVNMLGIINFLLRRLMYLMYWHQRIYQVAYIL